MTDITPINQAASTEASTQALATRQIEQVRAAMTIAKTFPRDEAQAESRLSRACDRPTFAEKAAYRFPRGGQTVTGPSVYMAREAARAWGNITYGIDMLPTDDGKVHIEAWAMDLESNTRVTAQDRFDKLVQRKLWDPAQGKKVAQWVTPDERDLRELVNRRGAIHIRNCLLQLLPADVIDRAMANCEATIADAAKTQLAGPGKEQTIGKLLKAFASHGIGTDDLEDYLGHSVRDVNPREYAKLVQMGEALRDGQATREELFPEKEQPAAPVDLTAALGEALAAQVKGSAGIEEAAE